MGSFVLIDQKKIQPAPGKKVIKADDYAAYLDANDLITEALAETDRIQDQARDEAQALCDRAYSDGLAKGRAAMARKMLEMISQTSTYLQDFEDQIVATVSLAVRKIIGEIPNHQRMVQVVSQALGVVRQQQQVIVRVSPQEEASIRDRVETIKAPWPTIRFLDVVPDFNLKPGTCVLESELGLVEASVEGQLDVLTSVLSQAFGRREEAVIKQMDRLQDQLREGDSRPIQQSGVA